jgi:hypothetical protein
MPEINPKWESIRKLLSEWNWVLSIVLAIYIFVGQKHDHDADQNQATQSENQALKMDKIAGDKVSEASRNYASQNQTLVEKVQHLQTQVEVLTEDLRIIENLSFSGKHRFKIKASQLNSLNSIVGEDKDLKVVEDVGPLSASKNRRFPASTHSSTDGNRLITVEVSPKIGYQQ